jgi:hypothetical protein
MKTRALASGFQAVSALVPDGQATDAFVEMGKMAKAHPEMFQVLIDWLLDFSLFMTSDPFFESKWLRILGGNREEWRPLSEEIKKSMPSSTVQLNTPEEFRAALDRIFGTVKEMLQAEKERKKS